MLTWRHEWKCRYFLSFKTIYSLSIKWSFLPDSWGGNGGISALRQRHRGSADNTQMLGEWMPGSESRSHVMPRGERVSEAVIYTSCSHLCKHQCLQTQLRQRRNSSLQPSSALDTSPRLTNDKDRRLRFLVSVHMSGYYFFHQVSSACMTLKISVAFANAPKHDSKNTYSVMWVKRECAAEVP